MRERPAQRGFTLVELMIALVLFSFAIAGVLSVAVTMTRAFREQRRIVGIENAVRAPMDFIVDAVRQASPGVPTGTIMNANPPCVASGFTVVDNINAPDELELVYASGGVVTTTHTLVDATSSSVTIPPAHAGQFAIGDDVVITDGNQGTLFRLTGVTANALQFGAANAACLPAGGYPERSVVVRAQRARFTVGTFDGVPALLMDPDGASGAATGEPLAENIEDFQVAIGMDTDDNGAITESANGVGDEWIGNANGDVLPGTGSIRGLRIVIVARENTELMGGTGFSYRPTALNRDGTTTADKYRRRVLTSTVEIRNLLGSP